MVVIFETIGFNLYMLRESKEQDEILIYNNISKTYNTYSKKRAINFLYYELEKKDICIISLLKEEDIEVDPKNQEKFKAFKIKVLNRIFDDEVKLVDNLGYKPIDSLTFTHNEKNYFNLYKKSKLLREFESNNNEFPRIKALIFNLVGNIENHYNYFNKWLAWQLQNPLNRLPTSIILQGEHGTGKTKFCELVLKNIFENNFTEIGQTEINADYNDFIVGKQLIVANEVIHNDNKFLVPDKLKNFVTDEYLSIKQRFKDTYYIQNYSQWIFVSNNQVPLKIEAGDRRYTIFKSKKLIDGFTLINGLIQNLDNELKGYLNYLLNLEVKFIEVSQPLDNKEKQDLIEASWNSVDDFFYHSKEVGGFDVLNKTYMEEDDIYKNYFELHNLSVGVCIISQNLYTLYKKFCDDAGYKPFGRANFIRELRRFGFSPSVQRIEEKTQRVVVL